MNIGRNIIFLFFFIISCIQSYQIINALNMEYTNWPIPFLLIISISNEPEISSLIVWYIGFATLSFYFMGWIKEKLYGYGKYLFVRNYNKNKFILFELFKVSKNVFLLISTQFFVFFLYGFFTESITKGNYLDDVLIKSVTIYLLCSIALVLIQMLLELYVSPISSFLIVNTYVMFFLSLWGYISVIDKGHQFIYLGISNYMMALRSNAFISSGVFINQNLALVILIIIISLVFLFAKYRITKLDIY